MFIFKLESVIFNEVDQKKGYSSLDFILVYPSLEFELFTHYKGLSYTKSYYEFSLNLVVPVDCHYQGKLACAGCSP